MSELEKIGRQIKAYREAFGINQTQIARFLGVDQSYISKIEKGERQISVNFLENLCDLFGCQLSDLDSPEPTGLTTHLSFRANAIDENDLKTISEIQHIALNLKEMKELLERK